ncbi:hypothetical protein MAH1_33970 [Sessilibacter sp. MAH1]
MEDFYEILLTILIFTIFCMLFGLDPSLQTFLVSRELAKLILTFLKKVLSKNII